MTKKGDMPRNDREKGVPRNDRGGGLSLRLFWCHCEPKAWQSLRNEILNTKSEILNNIK